MFLINHFSRLFSPDGSDYPIVLRPANTLDSSEQQESIITDFPIVSLQNIFKNLEMQSKAIALPLASSKAIYNCKQLGVFSLWLLQLL